MVTAAPKRFFRRPDWYGKVSGPAPRWHLFERVEHTVKQVRRSSGTFTVPVTVFVGRCGYEYVVEKIRSADGIGFSAMLWRDDIKTKSLRCSKCERRQSQPDKTGDAHGS